MNNAIFRIEKTISHLESFYKEERAKMSYPNNPFINTITGQIDGLKMALNILKENDEETKDQAQQQS